MKNNCNPPFSSPSLHVQVDVAACSAVAQLCFKLTESELKILLANMAEWRDFERIASSADSEEVYEADGTWQKYSRGVTYYRLISQLATKLRSIFLPSMVSQNISKFVHFLYYLILSAH
jgi:BP28CT (NUC211) domain